jgi:hypothetical protein
MTLPGGREKGRGSLPHAGACRRPVVGPAGQIVGGRGPIPLCPCKSRRIPGILGLERDKPALGPGSAFGDPASMTSCQSVIRERIMRRTPRGASAWRQQNLERFRQIHPVQSAFIPKGRRD